MRKRNAITLTKNKQAEAETEAEVDLRKSIVEVKKSNMEAVLGTRSVLFSPSLGVRLECTIYRCLEFRV